MTVKKQRAPRDPAPETPEKRRRLPRGTRKGRIVAEAARHFAVHGFAASTRDLAGAMGVTQALLYRYFPSKQALIDQVFETLFIERWKPAWDPLIGDRSRPLEARLIDFYRAFLGNMTQVSMRLFMRAALDGQGFPDRYTLALNDRILGPIVAELRHAAGLADPPRGHLLNGERELALMLHGGMVFLGIRKHIYGTPLPDDLGPQVTLHVRTFLGGALESLKALHKEPTPALFEMPVIGRRK